ncbi:Ff.00g042330.m01.CDS01 [Fusarium sp. VM40]|nr:Ff.00g042330.m01.CDS01 [Fusarium sp. VM40]
MAILVPEAAARLSLSSVVAVLFLLVPLYLIAQAIYFAFLHPLAKVPGRKLYGATQLPHLYHLVKGDWMSHLAKLHDQYGPVVRVGPEDVSFITAGAFKTIYGHKSSGGKDFPKDLRNYRQGRPVTNLITANQPDHKRMRRLLSHAFSQKALHSQEGIMRHYVDLFMTQLTERAHQGIDVNLVAWYNFATFDLIGHLTLGQSFGCLESGNYHPWVSNIFNSVRVIPISQSVVRLGLKSLMPCFVPSKFKAAYHETLQFAEHTALARLDSNDTKSHDFMSYVLRFNDERGMSRDEIIENSSLLITAGSETTATALSGASYLLLTNRDKYDKLTKEIRSAFNSEEEITVGRCDQLKYLVAVFQETLRMYPPAPAGFSRFTPTEGEFMEGYWVPGNTTVVVPHWPAFTSEFNFKDSKQFTPERWLGDPAYANDSKAVLHPFSAGSRDCIGKNLAYTEMRLLLTRLLWKFDLELLPESKGWLDQRVFLLWDKRALQVKLTEAKRVSP